MIFVTDSITVSDPSRVKQLMEEVRAEAETAGAADLKVFRSTNNPNKVLTTTWWPNHDALHSFEEQAGPVFNQRIKDIKQSEWDEDAWEEIQYYNLTERAAGPEGLPRTGGSQKPEVWPGGR